MLSNGDYKTMGEKCVHAGLTGEEKWPDYPPGQKERCARCW